MTSPYRTSFFIPPPGSTNTRSTSLYDPTRFTQLTGTGTSGNTDIGPYQQGLVPISQGITGTTGTTGTGTTGTTGTGTATGTTGATGSTGTATPYGSYSPNSNLL